MTRLRANIWNALTLVFAVGLTMFSLSNLVMKPWRVIPELGGDAAKNSFTYLYHSMYGKGYWFEGMNYPYGEHIVFTDGQPVISVILSYFDNITAGKALAVLWLLIGFSYVLSILFVRKILVHFKVPPLLAIVFSGIICIMTPQILRLQGHFALSYTCVIPMLFYWAIKYTEQFHWRYPVYYFLLGCIMSFFHPYYAAMMLVWGLSYAAGYVIFTKGAVIAKLRYVLPLFSSVLLVLVVVAVVMKLTDPVADRPVTPFNTLYETCTRLKQVVTSIHSPVWKSFKDTPRSYLISDGGEGYAYIGLVVGITAGICFVVGLLRSFREKRLNIIAEPTGFSPIWLFMAFSVLLLGMGIPFIWHIELMDYLAIFKQFRSLGRFSWIFYYIIAVYTAVVISQYFSKLVARRRFFAGIMVLILPLGLWGYEATGYIKYARYLSKKAVYNYDMFFSVEEQGWPSFLQEHKYAATDFQAVLMIPFFHVGTEKLWVGKPDWLVTLASKACLQLSLPMIDVMMSRSSWSQAKKQVKIAAGPYSEKPILDDIKSDKPFLLLHFEDDTLNPDQKYLLSASEYIGHISQCNVYACYPKRLAANDKRNADSIRRILPFIQLRDTVISGGGTCYIEHFDAGHGEQHIFGAGGYPVQAGDSGLIANIPVKPPADSQLYEFSCWFLLGDRDYKAPYVTLQLIDAEGRADTFYDALTRQSVDNYGMWFRASRYFWMQSNIRSVRCNLINIPGPTFYGMDELLLRPADALVISKGDDGNVMVNNHRLRK